MRIFIDKVTGTWGDADDLVILDVTDYQVNSLTNELATMSQSRLLRFAELAHAHYKKWDCQVCGSVVHWYEER